MSLLPPPPPQQHPPTLKAHHQEFEAQSRLSRALARQGRDDIPEPKHSKGSIGNGLASPSPTPPSGHARTRRHRRCDGGSSVTGMGEGAVEFLLRSAAAAGEDGDGEASVLDDEEAMVGKEKEIGTENDEGRTEEGSKTKEDEERSHRDLKDFVCSLSFLALDDMEENAISALFHLRTEYGVYPPSAPYAQSSSPPSSSSSSSFLQSPLNHSAQSAATNALSALPASHKAKMECSLALLALHRECTLLTEEEQRQERWYQGLLVQKGLLKKSETEGSGDCDTVDDDENFVGGLYCGEVSARVGAVGASQSSSTPSSTQAAGQQIDSPGQRLRVEHPKSPKKSSRRKLLTSKSKKSKINKTLPTPTTTTAIDAGYRCRYAHVLGYRREKARKRGGTRYSIPLPETLPGTPPLPAPIASACVGSIGTMMPTEVKKRERPAGKKVTVPRSAVRTETLTISRAGRTVRPSRKLSE